MLKLKFFLLTERKEIVTGGHKYDNDLFNIIQKNPEVAVKNEVVGKRGKSKALRLFTEALNSIKKSKGSDIIIYNSSTCLRLLPGFLWLKLFSRKKLYAIHHHFIYKEFSGLKRFVYKKAESAMLKGANKLIVPSPYIYDELKKIRKEEDLVLWRIPFETENSVEPHPKPGNLTFAGTIEPRKGLKYLFEALKILQDRGVNYKLDVLGKIIDQKYYEELKNYSNLHSLHINFRGFVDKDTKNKILEETDVFVFPSLLEGFGMVLVEAQVYGLPIVCFNNSAMPFTVKENINGFLIPDRDSADMANKIEAIITDRQLRRELSKGALENLKTQWTFSKYEETVNRYISDLASS